MLIKKRDITVEAIDEARQAESGPSVLALLKTPLAAYTHEQKLESYRRRIVESNLALIRQMHRHNDLQRQLLAEEVKDGIEPPLR